MSTRGWPIVLLLLLAAAKSSAAAGPSATYDPKTGYIQSKPGLPVFEPAVWAAPYLVTIRNVSYSHDNTVSPAEFGRWIPRTVSYISTWISTSRCSPYTGDSAFTNVTDTSCWYKNTSATTFDYWKVEHSEAFEEANGYCYALNRFEGTDCRPGSLSNGTVWNQYMDSVTCTLSNQVLVQDGAVPISRDQAIKGQPSSGHYIAALSRASFDSQIRYDALNKYHYMRKDADGTWSNKFPWSAPFNTDMEGKPITDPQAALLAGRYFVCGYYHVQPEKMTLGTFEREVSPYGPLATSWFQDPKGTAELVPGVTLEPFVRLPFQKEATRFATGIYKVDSESQADLDWERKRGTREYEEWKQKQLIILELVPGSKSSSTDGRNGRQDRFGRKLLL